MNDYSVPICVELVGALTPLNLIHENFLSVAKTSPPTLIAALWQRFMGRSSGHSMHELENFTIETDSIPLRQNVVTWLGVQRTRGRRIVLIATNRDLANKIAARLNLFDEIIANDDEIVRRFGEKGFDCVGSVLTKNSLWQVSRQAIVVGNPSLGARLGQNLPVTEVIPAAKPGIRTWIKAFRIHQWVKNGLIFIPSVLAHVIVQPKILILGALAFLSFGLCASSVYLFNDLLDLNADRQHPRKRHRPFAAGELSVRNGILVAVLLSTVSAVLAIAIGLKFALVLAVYYLLTWAYSVRLKQIPLVDVMLLAGLYTIRIVAGAAATEVPLSFWLLAFSVFIFLSLGFVKRYAELAVSSSVNKSVSQARGYTAVDLPLIMSLGTASGYCSVVVMALYLNSADSSALYQHHKPLWLICPVMLFWISRIWITTTRGQMHDDPVVFALRDKASLLILGALGLIVLVSI